MRWAKADRSARRPIPAIFQNLNGSLGSLAEVVSISGIVDDSLHHDGRAGSKRDRGRARAFPAHYYRLAPDSCGYRRPSGHRPLNSTNWYVNNSRESPLFVRAIARVHGGEFWSGSGGGATRMWWGWRHHGPRRRRFRVMQLDPSAVAGWKLAGCVAGGPARRKRLSSATNAASVRFSDNRRLRAALAAAIPLIRSMDVLAFG